MIQKIKLSLLAFLLGTSCTLSAFDETTESDPCGSESFEEGVYEAYRYGTVGVGPIIFIPNLSVGYRERYAKFGWDSALGYSTVGYAHQVSLHLIRHYYLSPSRVDSTYLGLGLMGSGFFSNKMKGAAAIAPDFVFGKVLNTTDASRHFIEMHVAVPNVYKDSKRTGCIFFPAMYVKYGMSF